MKKTSYEYYRWEFDSGLGFVAWSNFEGKVTITLGHRTENENLEDSFGWSRDDYLEFLHKLWALRNEKRVSESNILDIIDEIEELERRNWMDW